MKVGKFYNLKDSDMKVQVLEKINPNEHAIADNGDENGQIFLDSLQSIVNKIGFGVYPCPLLGSSHENGLFSGDITFFDDGGKMLKVKDIQNKLFDIDLESEHEEPIFKIQQL